MKVYDVNLIALRHTYRGHNTVWGRGVKANLLSEAAEKAKQMHPNLGITPTQMSMGWEVVKGTP
jgi:hypothetical protein